MFLVPIKIHRWLAVALEEAENTGTSGPEPTAYHILTMVGCLWDVPFPALS